MPTKIWETSLLCKFKFSTALDSNFLSQNLSDYNKNLSRKYFYLQLQDLRYSYSKQGNKQLKNMHPRKYILNAHS